MRSRLLPFAERLRYAAHAAVEIEYLAAVRAANFFTSMP
jgi:hypothetical protein